jgi:ComF family protein
MPPTSLDALVRLLLAPVCVACRRPLERPLLGPVCDACWDGVVTLAPPLCDHCGDQLSSTAGVRCGRCVRQPPHFAIARSAGLYQGTLREMIHAFKYDRRRVLAVHLARLMAETARPLLETADAVVPVPLHPWRTLHRGFNQADDLARQFRRPVWRVLRRTRTGSAQAGSAQRQRQINVAGAFSARSIVFTPIPGTTRARLTGATVVLIDDVMTTGATLDACSRVLLEAGVKSVGALTAARAVATAPR